MSINSVTLIGNLTRDPELRQAGETPVTTLRLAVNSRRKVDGEWTEVPGYFDVTIFGKQAENAAKYLLKGRAIGVEGRLDWREFTDKEGNKRQAVGIIANDVQYLGGKPDDAPAPVASSSAAEMF